jgi:hypothetical protein
VLALILLAGGIPLGLLVIGWFFKGTVAKDLFQWKNTYMGVELCVAALVEAMASLGELCTRDNVSGHDIGMRFGVLVFSLASLMVVTAVYHWHEGKPEDSSFLYMFWVGNGVGYFGLAAVLAVRGFNG